ncbi:MAG: AraC family transcriptional regulator [Clostridiales bacterium]|nr:AraC family transcriptional regulator [Clostridiales bacterium]
MVLTKSEFRPNELSDHIHTYIEIVYISDGAGYHILNGRKYKVRKGDILFIPKESVHNYEAIGTVFEWINCMFTDDALHIDGVNISNAEDILKISLFTNLFDCVKLNAADVELFAQRDEFETLFSDMLKEYELKRTGYREILEFSLNVLLIKILRGFTSAAPPQQTAKKDLVHLVLDYFNINKTKDIRLDEIAKRAFFSPKYFQRLFKRQTGKSLTDFLHEQRVKAACELLEKTDKSVTQIMNEVGYNDTKFFYSIFKRYMKTTPGNYKKLLS